MRKVVIMSGVSGSGKSTYAMKAHQGAFGKPRTISVVSADTYFMKDGVYNFDPSKLSDAHGECFRSFILALQTGWELVVVDNTNTTAVEIAPYILGAQAWGYEVEVITVMCETDDDIEEAAARNSHGVPLSGVRAQHRRLCAREMMPWWKNTFIPVRF